MNVFKRWGTKLVKEWWGVGGVVSLLPKIAPATIYSLNVIEINPELPRSIFDIFKQIIIFCNPSWEPNKPNRSYYSTDLAIFKLWLRGI